MDAPYALGRLSRSKKAAPLVCAPEKSEEGVAVHLFRVARHFGPQLRGLKPPQPQDVHLNRG